MASRRHATRRRPKVERSAGGETLRRVGSFSMKMLAGALIGVCVYGAYLVGGRVIEQVNTQRVELVRIEGDLRQVDESEIQRVVSAYAGQSFLRIDLTRLKSDLETIAWVRQASVQREWPETLIVHVTEQIAIARWNGSDLLNQYGERFTPGRTEVQQGLPLLEGPAGREVEVMQQYQKFSQVLVPHGLRLGSVSLTPRGAWQVKLNNGVVVNIGKSHVVERLQRFTRVLEGKLFGDFHDIEYIDLRYRNGIAVRRITTEDTLISSL